MPTKNKKAPEVILYEYKPETGKLPGLSFEEQTEDFLNDLSFRTSELKNELDSIDIEKIDEMKEKVEETSKKVDEFDRRITDNTNKNTEQDNRLNSIEQKNIEQDGRLDAIEQKNVEQDNRLNAVESKNVEQDNRLTNIESKNVEQDNRLTAIESKNVEQDTAIEEAQKRADEAYKKAEEGGDTENKMDKDFGNIDENAILGVENGGTGVSDLDALKELVKELPDGGTDGQILAVAQQENPEEGTPRILSWIDNEGGGSKVRVLSDPGIAQPLVCPIDRDISIRIIKGKYQICPVVKYTVSIYRRKSGESTYSNIYNYDVNVSDSNILTYYRPASSAGWEIGDNILVSVVAQDDLENRSRLYPDNRSMWATGVIIDANFTRKFLSVNNNIALSSATHTDSYGWYTFSINGDERNAYIGTIPKNMGTDTSGDPIFYFFDSTDKKVYAIKMKRGKHEIHTKVNNYGLYSMSDGFVFYASGVAPSVWSTELEEIPMNGAVLIEGTQDIRIREENISWVMGRTGDTLYLVSNYGDIVEKRDGGDWVLRKERISHNNIYRAYGGYYTALGEFWFWDSGEDISVFNSLINGQHKMVIFSNFPKDESSTKATIMSLVVSLPKGEGSDISFADNGAGEISSKYQYKGGINRCSNSPLCDLIFTSNGSYGSPKDTDFAYSIDGGVTFTPCTVEQKVLAPNFNRYFDRQNGGVVTKIRGVWYRYYCLQNYAVQTDLLERKVECPCQYSTDGVNWSLINVPLSLLGTKTVLKFFGFIDLGKDVNKIRVCWMADGGLTNTFPGTTYNNMFYYDITAPSDGSVIDASSASGTPDNYFDNIGISLTSWPGGGVVNTPLRGPILNVFDLDAE